MIENSPAEGVARRFRALATGAGASAALIGAIGLCGWLFGAPRLTSYDVHWIAMKPNAALCLVLLGAALSLSSGEWARRRPASALAAAAALAVAGLTLLEYVVGIDLGIDQLLFREAPGALGTVFPGRMMPVVALCFVLLASSSLISDDASPRRAGWSLGLASAAGTLAAVALCGYAYSVRLPAEQVVFPRVSMPASFGVIALSVGILASHPELGVAAILVSGGRGGASFRRLLPMAVVGPLVLGWLVLHGHYAGLYEHEEAMTLLMVGTAGLFSWLIYGHSVNLERWSEALRRASAYNRGLIEASLDPLVTIGPDGRITDVSRATEAVTGLPRERLIDTDFSDYFADPAAARAGYERAFREGSVRDYPLEIRHRDGRTTPVLYNATVYRDEAGTTVGVFAAARDVSELRKAEEALRRAGAYNRGLIETSLDPLVTIGPDGRITDVSRATEAATGRLRAELIGSDFASYFTEPERARAGYEQAFREGSVRDYALEIRHRDGRATPVLYNASVYRDESGGVAGVFAAARDVTERKRAEDAIRLLNAELEERVRQRTDQLERANKELEAFAYSVSHDLRAPLRAIDGFSQILVEDYAPKLEPECRRYLGLVRDGARQMGRLIDDLLSFSRLSRQALARTRLRMAAIVAQACETLAQEREGRKVALKIGALPDAEGDAQLVRQVWINLISNALKFSRAKAEAVVEIGASEVGGETAYFVKDNGAGFDMRYVDKLFKVFQRLHRAEEFEGTGVGLAIVARIVERHGGRVWAEGAVGHGAVFRFTLGGGDYGRANAAGGDSAGRGQPAGRGVDAAQSAPASRHE